MTTLTADQFSSQLDLSEKTILLPVETDAIVHFADRSDFPTLGRLKRLYIEQNTGVAWAWTGTTYQKTSPTTDEFAALQGEVDLAEGQISTLQTGLASAQSTLSTAQGNISSLQSDAANLNTRLDTAEGTISTTLPAHDSRISANETAISITLPGLISDAESFEQLDSYNDFPPTGRLNRLYLDKSNGTLWRWTGTTYSPVPGEQDGGTY